MPTSRSDGGRAAAATPATPATSFACLWCGRSWTVRSPDDLEGFARLCPDCLGKAGDNPFLRFRLRAALEARAASTSAAAVAGPAPSASAAEPPPPRGTLNRDLIAYYDARAPEYDDWYLRRGRYARGPIHDAAWNAELDAAGRWLDTLPMSGRIVELAAGTGWWSTLLVGKGELWMYDAAEAPLERARERLVAHGLRAHLHVRDAWAEPDGDPAGALFLGFWLSHVERQRTVEFLSLAGRWLAPGGRIALIDSLPDPQSGAADHEAPTDDRAVRRLADGREFTIVKTYRTVDEVSDVLAAAGFTEIQVTATGRFFLLATATRP
ncbi:MAG TPA: class I SAM-dependent methyltransferase [Candidatus Limnocylindrales bacterium]|nr:class I SAM-dependent methyltransferase [Candidatus Limnocylindrales bacterium]